MRKNAKSVATFVRGLRDMVPLRIALVVLLAVGGCETITSPTAVTRLSQQGQPFTMTLVKPSGAGSLAEFTPVGAATNWQAVFNASRTDYNTHVVTTAPFEGPIAAIDLFDVDASGVSGYIDQITLRFDAYLHKQAPGDLATFKYAISDDGGATFSFGPTLSNNFDGIVSWDLSTNPKTGKRWLKQDLEDLEFGYYGSGWAPNEQSTVNCYAFEIEVTTRGGGVVTRTVLNPKVDKPNQSGTPWVAQPSDLPGYWRHLVDGSFSTFLRATGGPATNAFILDKIPISRNVGVVRACFVARSSDGTPSLTPFLIHGGVEYDGGSFVVGNPGTPEASLTYVHEWLTNPAGDDWKGGIVSSLQGGIKVDPVSGEAFLYELYFEVDHIQHPGPALALIRVNHPHSR